MHTCCFPSPGLAWCSAQVPGDFVSSPPWPVPGRNAWSPSKNIHPDTDWLEGCAWGLIHPDGAGVPSSPRAAPQQAWEQWEPPVPPRPVRLWGLVYGFCLPTERCRGAARDTPSSLFALSPQWWPGHRQLLLTVGQVGPMWGPCPPGLQANGEVSEGLASPSSLPAIHLGFLVS